MNNCNFKIMRLRDNDSGIILIVVLWILIILTLIAIGLGRRVGTDLEITQFSIGKLRSRYIAISGLVYALGKIREDSGNSETNRIDTKYQCGFFKEEHQGPEELFGHKQVGQGHFDIRFAVEDANGIKSLRYGLSDEESKLNINGLTDNNTRIFQYLLEERGVDSLDAKAIASALIDWKDANDDLFDEDGAENDYYLSLTPAYACKNRLLQSIEELMLVKGMTPEVFKEIRPYITVYPSSGKLQINFNTASAPVLTALARYFTGSITNTHESDARSLVNKILIYRTGADGYEATSDDRIVELGDLALNAKEKTIFLLMKTHETAQSQFIRVQVKGVDKPSQVATRIDAVIRRQDLALLYWRRF